MRRLACPLRLSTGCLFSASQPSRTGVVIAGAGPVGLTLSLLLSNFGVQHVIVDRAAGPTVHPQAHYINFRSMEIMRNMAPGLDTQITELTEPTELWRHYIYCTSVAGFKIGAVDHFGTGRSTLNTMMSHSPCRVAHLPQSRLVPLMVERATGHGTGELLWNREVKKFEQLDDCVKVDIVGPDGATSTFKADYLIGADGASSTVRTQLGIPLQGSVGLQHLMNVHFTYQDLNHLAASHPAMLYFVYNPAVVGVIVAHDWQAGECVMQIPFFPPQQSEADFPEEVCAGLVRSALGAPTGTLVIHKVNRWTMSAVNASAYRAGRVLLVGDSCHQMPPAGGFGMNSGMADAHNLAWKLACVLHGWCHPDILDSYQLERSPVIDQNISLSQRNFQQVLEVTRSLGLDANHLKVLQNVVQVIPGGLRDMLFDRSVWLARKQLDFVSEENPIWAARLRRVRGMFASGKSLALLYPKQDLGIHYTGGCLMSPETSQTTDDGPAVGVQEYAPHIAPGHRFPHFWVEKDGHKMSSIDLFGGKCLQWQLIVNGEAECSAWVEAVNTANNMFAGAPVSCVVVNGSHGPLPHGKTVHTTEDAGHWGMMSNFIGQGAVLVRPDGHIAWVTSDQLHETGCRQQLCEVLTQLGFIQRAV